MGLVIAVSRSREGSGCRRLGGESSGNLGRAEKGESAASAAASSDKKSKFRCFLLLAAFGSLVLRICWSRSRLVAEERKGKGPKGAGEDRVAFIFELWLREGI